MNNKNRGYSKPILDYFETHQNAKLLYYSSSMIIRIHANSSYLSKLKAHSRVGGRFFMVSQNFRITRETKVLHTQ